MLHQPETHHRRGRLLQSVYIQRKTQTFLMTYLTSTVPGKKRQSLGSNYDQYSVTPAFRHATAEVSGIRHLP